MANKQVWMKDLFSTYSWHTAEDLPNASTWSSSSCTKFTTLFFFFFFFWFPKTKYIRTIWLWWLKKAVDYLDCADLALEIGYCSWHPMLPKEIGGIMRPCCFCISFSFLYALCLISLMYCYYCWSWVLHYIHTNSTS